MRRILALAAVLTSVALASCGDGGSAGGGENAAPAAATYTASGDVSGYYMPMDPVQSGQWTLDHMFVGQAHEFASWQAGERTGTFAPVMLQFEDASSPMAQTEMGEQRSVTARVLPTTFTVNDAQIRFEGRSAELGVVSFDGRLDQGALSTARRNLGDEGVVLTGSLKIGDGRPQAVRMRWWMGD
jgi:hypothetical protein